MPTRYQECVDECLACMKACNFCFNACLIDDRMEPFAHCIHLTKDCADIALLWQKLYRRKQILRINFVKYAQRYVVFVVSNV